MAPKFGGYHWESWAGWSLAWRIPPSESGLEIWWADFHGRRVLWRGSAPFAIVPYHIDPCGVDPKPPNYTFKDGFDPQCDGASFELLQHGAPNAWNKWPAFRAAQDTDGVVVSKEAANDFLPARMSVTAKFQCGWYQYVHSWEFDAYGAIHPQVAMGGQLNPNCPERSHIHHFYFRIDLDIDGQFPNDVCEVFDHNNLSNIGDNWTLVTKQQKLLADSHRDRKWRVRNTKAKNATGEMKAYEIELPQMAGRDDHSTGDVWVTVYRGDGFQQGEKVATDPSCSDVELENAYANGPLDVVNGSDIVLWLVIRAHHETRAHSEEAVFLPYHYEEFSITPRSFEVFRQDPSRSHG